MNRSRVVLISLMSVAFCLTLVSSVRADSVHQPPGQQKFNFDDIQSLGLPDIDRANVRDFLSDHFDGNNGNHFGFVNSLDAVGTVAGAAGNHGRHLGFSVSAVQGGVKFGLANPRRKDSAVPTQNPEPTGMLLLGTGLAAVGAFARRAHKRRRSEHR